MIINGMNKLEVLGLNIVAARMMENHWTARILIEILKARGNPVSAEFLGSAQGHALAIRKTKPSSVKVAICRMRQELADLGLDGVVDTVTGMGYVITPENNDRIVGALMEYLERV